MHTHLMETGEPSENPSKKEKKIKYKPKTNNVVKANEKTNFIIINKNFVLDVLHRSMAANTQPYSPSVLT